MHQIYASSNNSASLCTLHPQYISKLAPNLSKFRARVSPCFDHQTYSSWIYYADPHHDENIAREIDPTRDLRLFSRNKFQAQPEALRRTNSGRVSVSTVETSERKRGDNGGRFGTRACIETGAEKTIFHSYPGRSDSIIPEARILRLMNFVGCAEYRFPRSTLRVGLTFWRRARRGQHGSRTPVRLRSSILFHLPPSRRADADPSLPFYLDRIAAGSDHRVFSVQRTANAREAIFAFVSTPFSSVPRSNCSSFQLNVKQGSNCDSVTVRWSEEQLRQEIWLPEDSFCSRKSWGTLRWSAKVKVGVDG